MFTIGLAILALLQIADVWTTNRVIANGGREDNPVLKWIMDRLGEHWWIAKLGIAGLAIFILYSVGQQLLSWIVLIGLIGAYGWVVHHNYEVTQRQEKRKRPGRDM